MRFTVLLVVTLLAGIALGRFVVPGLANPAAHSGSESRGATALASPPPRLVFSPFRSSGSCEKDVEELQTRLKGAEEQASFYAYLSNSLRESKEGTPISWDGIPARHQAAAIEAALRKSIQDCRIPISLASMHCEEPPCIAEIRSATNEGWQDGLGLLDKCPAWDDYGSGFGVYSTSIECPDGSKEYVVLMSPGWDAPDDEAADKNLLKRVKARWEGMAEGFKCPPGK